MNISPLTVYLWQQADSIAKSCSSASIAFFLFGICAIVAFIIMLDGIDRIVRSMLFALIPWAICAFFWLAGTFIPSSKTIAMMVVIPKLADSKIVQQDLPDLYDAAISALKSQLKPAEEKK